MKWLSSLLVALLIVSFALSHAEADQKKKKHGQASTKNKICADCDQADSEALEALIIKKREESLSGTQVPSDPVLRINKKWRGTEIHYYIKTLDELSSLNLYRQRVLRNS